MMYSKQMQIGKRKRPKQKDRTKITKKEYDKAVEVFGSTCFCSNPYIEMHHIVFRSSGGKGKWRNLIPLCNTHHKLAHTDNEYRRHLEIQRKRMFGPHYFKDAYDLYEEGLIDEPTEEKLEDFFVEEVKRIHG